MLHQIVSLVGAAFILGAYVALQLKKLPADSRTFSLLNFVGSSILTYSAVVDRNYGFIVLEATWALISLLPLLRSPKAG